MQYGMQPPFLKIGEGVEFRIDQCVSSRLSRDAEVLGFSSTRAERLIEQRGSR
jgi:hypothetical protein